MSKNQNYKVMSASGSLGVKPDCLCVEKNHFQYLPLIRIMLQMMGLGQNIFFTPLPP
jgi:hypothetical protein